MGLSAAEILGANDRKLETVDCPEWGGPVHVRSLSVAEAFALEQELRPLTEVPEMMAAQFAAFVCDSEGKRLFATTADAMQILTRKTQVVRRIIERGMTLNRLSSLEDEKEK